jgi:DNA polymerase elongation subunit (family B)
MNYPDIVTGWNVENFDIAYLVNRVANLFGESETSRFSIHKKKPNERIDKFTDELSFEISGLSQLDYMRLFKKFGFSYGNQESYSLDHISNVILGEKKLDYSEYGSLLNLYKEDHQKFIDYNIIDTQLVVRIDEKTAMLDVCMALAHKANVNYDVAFGTTKLWDTFIFNVLVKSDIVIPEQRSFTSNRTIQGAYVREPVKGLYNWAISVDLDGLYPHLIMQYNMSPETLLPNVIPDINVQALLNRKEFELPKDTCMSATGQLFSTKTQGIFPKIIEELYDERKLIKKKMIGIGQKIEGLKDELNRLKSV